MADAAAAEQHRQLVHAAEQGVDRWRELLPPAVAVGQKRIHLLVRQPLAALDRRGMELGVRADAFGRVVDEDRLRVPHAVRLQARQAVGNQLRQHRQHAVGQVDARRPIVGLAVQRRPRADEVRNVGNVDAQPPMPVVELYQRNGVVEIAGVDRINRDDRLAGQVEAVADRLVEAVGLLPGLVQGVLGELFGQAELADDGKRIDARLALRPQDLDDHALAVMDGRGKADHLDDHLVVGPGVLRAGIADEDRLGEELAIDLHEGRALRLEVRADELPRLPLDDLHDAPARAKSSAGFLGASPLDVLDFDGHHVAAGRIERVFGRDEDVVGSSGRLLSCRPPSSPAGGSGRTKPKPFCVR